jgi:hypothetical protein
MSPTSIAILAFEDRRTTINNDTVTDIAMPTSTLHNTVRRNVRAMRVRSIHDPRLVDVSGHIGFSMNIRTSKRNECPQELH